LHDIPHFCFLFLSVVEIVGIQMCVVAWWCCGGRGRKGWLL